ncbi:MAG: hypothetical protein R2932_58350 [Caldilineaceae bacterium]
MTAPFPEGSLQSRSVHSALDMYAVTKGDHMTTSNNRSTLRGRNQHRQPFLLLFLLLLLLPNPVVAAPLPPPYLVADINMVAGTEGSSITEFVELDGIVYFPACDYEHGCELWKSDGTSAGTQLVRDIAASGQYSSSRPRDLTIFKGAIYFTATEPWRGRELWKSNGTQKAPSA